MTKAKRRNRFRPVLLVLALYGAWPLYQFLDFWSVQPFAEPVDTINWAASIVSYNWLLLNVLVALKIPLLQRALPYDFRIRAHIVTSALMTTFLVWHSLYYLVLNPKQISVVTWTLMGVFLLLLVLSLLWIPLPGFRWLHQKKAPYDALKLAHKTLFLALAALAYIHIIDAKIIGVASPVSSFGFQALFVVTGGAFGFTRLHNRFLPRLRVVSVTTKGSITSLRLTVHPRLRYRAGQFAFLRFDHPHLKHEEHPFSFTSAGGEPQVEFAVKAVGDFTSRLAVLQPGDRVRVNGGFGAFRLPRSPRPLVLIGTGIGAAPMISLLKDLARRPERPPVVCFIGANSRDDLVDPDWWDSLPSLLPELRLHLLLAEQGAPMLSEDLFQKVLDRPSESEFFLCSSDRVRAHVLSALRALKVPAGHIHYENFTFG